MLKKIISVFVAVFTLSTVFALYSFAASVPAEGGQVKSYADLVKALGGDGVGQLKYDADGNVDHFFLIKDITLSSPVVITEGKYTIIGAGSVIRSSSDEGTLFEIEGEETVLSLGDKNETDVDAVDLTLDGNDNTAGGSLVNISSGATLEMYAGVLIEDAITSSSGAAVSNEGYFVMYGGKIQNCRAVSSGGAVFNKGEIAFALGTIADCSANNGGAVCNEGKISFLGTAFTGCSATKGGFLYNSGSAKLVASTVSECKAPEGAGVYNLGTFDIDGGKIEGCIAENEGGGVYNVGTVNFKGGYITSNKAKNGGSIYNAATLNVTEQAQVFGGKADVFGANVYNAAEAVFNFSGGSVSSGISLYGAGVYNLGTVNMSGGGVYSNQATVAEGILNHGTLNLSGMGYVGDNDDIYVVITDDNKHVINLNSDWSYKSRKLNLSCGIFTDGKYEYLENKGDKLITTAEGIDVIKRFTMFNKDSRFVLSDNGTLKSAPVTVSGTVFIVIGAVLAFAATVTAIVVTVRYFDKKRLLSGDEG